MPELQELEDPQRLLPPFEGEHLEWTWTSGPVPIYLPQGQAPWVPTWFVEGIYPLYDWVDQGWQGAPRNQVLGMSPI